MVRLAALPIRCQLLVLMVLLGAVSCRPAYVNMNGRDCSGISIPLFGGGDVRRLEFDSSGRFLAALTRYKLQYELHLWDLASGEPTSVLTWENTASFAFSPVSAWMVVARSDDPDGYDPTWHIHVRGIPSWKDQATLPTERDTPWGRARRGRPVLAVTPDGECVIAVWDDGYGDVWEVATGRRILQFRAKRGIHIAVDPRQAWVVIRSRGGVRQLGDPKVPVLGAFSLSTGKALSGFFDTSVGWNVPPLGGDQIAVTADRRLYASWVGEVRVWEVSDDRADPLEAIRPSRPVVGLAIDPLGQYLATGHTGGGVVLRDLHSGAVVKEWIAHGHPKGGMALAWSPRGRRLASGASDGSVRLWRVERE